MATAASIPPELFEDILFYVCEDTDGPVYSDSEGPDLQYRETLKNIAACSLTCVYWARVCRQRMFRRVWIKSYDKLHAFSSLISNTPKGFEAIVDYVWYVTLVQHVEDRPWLYHIQLQPSLLPQLPFATIRIHIIDTTGGPLSLRRSTYRRLFSGLPRTPPSSCHSCRALTLYNPHFRALRDVDLLLNKFAFLFGSIDLTFSGISWATEVSLERDLLSRNTLEITRHDVYVTVEHSSYSVEEAWLAYSAVMRGLSRSNSTSHEADIRLELRPSAQRAILELGRLICRNSDGTIHGLEVRTTLWDTGPHKDLFGNCFLGVQRIEPEKERTDVDFRLHTSSWCAEPANVAGEPTIVDHIAVMCVSIKSLEVSYSQHEASTYISRVVTAYPWKDIANLCAGHEGFTQLQLHFTSRDDLIHFMETRRAVLAGLAGRISVFYRAEEDYKLHAADYATLADIGDAWDHGYIDTY